MNILPLVMSLLLIFACTFSLSLRKSTITQGVEKTYQAHMNASRKIRNSYESLCYEQMRSEAKEKQPKEKQQNETPPQEKEIEQLNLACARLNLWPLLADGIEKHTDLYETAAQLLGSLYSKHLFEKEARFEYCLLDALLDAARQSNTDPNNPRILLEKLSLKEFNVKPLYPLQTTYYHMLKGTKKSSLDQGYPSLLDYFALENKKSRICLHHASQEMVVGLFGSRAGPHIYAELQKSETHLSFERLKDICTQNGKLALSDEFLKLIDVESASRHTSGQKTLVKEDADVCLKQKVFFPS